MDLGTVFTLPSNSYCHSLCCSAHTMAIGMNKSPPPQLVFPDDMIVLSFDFSRTKCLHRQRLMEACCLWFADLARVCPPIWHECAEHHTLNLTNWARPCWPIQILQPIHQTHRNSSHALFWFEHHKSITIRGRDELVIWTRSPIALFLPWSCLSHSHWHDTVTTKRTNRSPQQIMRQKWSGMKFFSVGFSDVGFFLHAWFGDFVRSVWIAFWLPFDGCTVL